MILLSWFTICEVGVSNNPLAHSCPIFLCCLVMDSFGQIWEGKSWDCKRPGLGQNSNFLQPSLVASMIRTWSNFCHSQICKDWARIANLCLFLFSNFRKGRLLYIRPVGRSVGWLVDVTINFFNIYRHKSPLLTQYHSIPISTKLYWPSTTKLQPVSPHTDPVPCIPTSTVL